MGPSVTLSRHFPVRFLCVIEAYVYNQKMLCVSVLLLVTLLLRANFVFRKTDQIIREWCLTRARTFVQWEAVFSLLLAGTLVLFGCIRLEQ